MPHSPQSVRSFVISSAAYKDRVWTLAKKAGLDTSRIPYDWVNEAHDSGLKAETFVKLLKQRFHDEGMIGRGRDLGSDRYPSEVMGVKNRITRHSIPRSAPTSILRDEYEAAKRAYHAKGRALAKATGKKPTSGNRAGGNTSVIEGYPDDEKLRDFHGNVIEGVRLHVTSSWPTPKSYVGSRMYAYAAVVNGTSYHGRGFGNGLLLRLRAGRTRK